jgi:hypothetical protein
MVGVAIFLHYRSIRVDEIQILANRRKKVRKIYHLRAIKQASLIKNKDYKIRFKTIFSCLFSIGFFSSKKCLARYYLVVFIKLSS